MRFPSLVFDSVPNMFRTQEGGRSSRRRRPEVSLELLEARELKTGGVTLANGMLTITAPLNSGNVAQVAINQAHNNAVAVTLNGVTTEFNASQVQALTYLGGAGGHDTFINNTAIIGIENGWGGGNTFVGGSGQDFISVFGDGNTIYAGSGFEVVYTNGGQDTITGNAIVM